MLFLLPYWSSVSVVAHENEIFSQPHAFSIRVPDELINKPYTSSNGKADWTITAWHIPTGPLSLFVKSQYSGKLVYKAESGTNYIDVSYEQGKFSDVVIHQSSVELPCKLTNGTAREFDFFLHPNLVGNDYEESAIQSPAQGKSAGDMKRLTLYAEVSAQYELVDRPQKCYVNQGSVLLALILVNKEAKQTLFYQLALMELCGGGNTVRDVSCRSKRNHPAFSVFSDHTPFGVDDKISLLGKPFLEPGERKYIAVDVLPRIVNFIESDQFSIDNDIYHWKIGGMTAGQNIWGNINLQTRWISMGLRAEF